MILPNAFLIGAAKCGTTSLTHWLSHNPDVCIAKGKEPNYFNINKYAKGDKWYSRKYYNHYNSEKIIMDNNILNLVIPFVSLRIKKSCGHLNPKFIILAREPVERAYSHWWMQHTQYSPGYARETFSDAIDYNFSNFNYEKFKYEYDRMLSFDGVNDSYIPTYIEQGLYYHNISRYVKLFGKDSIKVLFTCDMNNNQGKVYDEACDFLEINKHDRPVFIIKKKTKTPYKENNNLLSLCDKYLPAKKMAVNIFMRDVIRLSKFCDRDLITEWGYDKL